MWKSKPYNVNEFTIRLEISLGKILVVACKFTFN